MKRSIIRGTWVGPIVKELGQRVGLELVHVLVQQVQGVVYGFRSQTGAEPLAFAVDLSALFFNGQVNRWAERYARTSLH